MTVSLFFFNHAEQCLTSLPIHYHILIGLFDLFVSTEQSSDSVKLEFNLQNIDKLQIISIWQKEIISKVTELLTLTDLNRTQKTHFSIPLLAEYTSPLIHFELVFLPSGPFNKQLNKSLVNAHYVFICESCFEFSEKYALTIGEDSSQNLAVRCH